MAKSRIDDRATLSGRRAEIALGNDLSWSVSAKARGPYRRGRYRADAELSLTPKAESLRQLLLVALAFGLGGRKLRCDHKDEGEFQHRVPTEVSAPSG